VRTESKSANIKYEAYVGVKDLIKNLLLQSTIFLHFRSTYDAQETFELLDNF
jgi:hypothetical protein